VTDGGAAHEQRPWYGRWAWVYDALYAAKDYAGEAERVHELIQQRRPGAGSLLDVACGTGRHLEHLRRDYDVEGVDLSGEMLDIARERLPGVALRQADMFDLTLGRQFDAVICLFSAIGYATTRALLRRAVAGMAAHLRAGGVLIVEPWIERAGYQVGHVAIQVVDQPALKVGRLSRSELADDVSVIAFHFLVGTPERIDYFTERHALGLFTRGEYEDAFRSAGLSVEHIEGGLIGRGLYLGMAVGA
jgi:SAM-dependent methyltransferase